MLNFVAVCGVVCGCLCWLAKAVVIDLLAQAVTSTVTVTETFPVVVQPVQTVPVQGTGPTQGVSGSLVVSIIALGVAGLSLLWNWLSWWRSGPRLKIEVSDGPYFDVASGKLLSAVEVEISNAGRMETTIRDIDFVADNDSHLWPRFFGQDGAHGIKEVSIGPGKVISFFAKREDLEVWTLRVDAPLPRSAHVRIKTGHRIWKVKVPDRIFRGLVRKPERDLV